VPIQQLRDYLANIPPGSIADESETESEVEQLLAACWDSLVGDSGGMTAEKLSDRTEGMEWMPPELTFRIARHGGYVLGSTREEIQAWTVDLKAGERSCAQAGYRQVTKSRPRLDTGPIAEEIAKLIEGGRSDPRLNWRKDGSVVVDIGKVIPTDGKPKQTIEGQRKRFWKDLDAALAPRWERRSKTYTYFKR